jgi:hypothetical protein
LLIRKNSLLIGVDLFATLNQCLLVKIIGRESTFESLLCLKLLGVFGSDCLLDVFHFLVTLFLAILLHFDALLLSESAGPNLNIVDLFVLGHFKSFLLTTQDILVEGHDCVVIKILLSAFQINDTILANLFDASLRQFIEYFSHSELHLLVELLVEFILFPHGLVLFLLLFKLNPALVFLNFTHFSQHLHLLLKVTLDQVLVLAHLFL